jgi:hypothetical protein
MKSEAAAAESAPIRWRNRVIVGATVLVLFLAAYFWMLASFQAEGEQRANGFVAIQDEHDQVEITASVLSVNPTQGEMNLRLQFEPQGTFADKGLLSRDLTLFVDSATGNVERFFSKGKVMNPTDVTVNLDGAYTDYPFDRYQASLYLYMTSSEKNPVVESDVAVTLTFLSSQHGLRITTKLDPKSSEANPIIDIDIARASSTIIFAVMVMVIMWLLALCVLAWALSIVLLGKKIEATLFGWVGTMLFAFPALRSAVPGSPPIGSLNDYLAFFWAEAIVAVGLVIAVTTYLRRLLKA